MENKNQEPIDLAKNAGGNNTSAASNPNGMKIIAVVCAILAVAGIGFGVYNLLKKPEATPTCDSSEVEAELAEYKQKYAVIQNYVKELEASGTEIPEDIQNEEVSWWNTYVQNVKKQGQTRANLFGNTVGGNGCGYDTASQPAASAFIDATGHLTIKAHNGGKDSQWETVLEADGFLSAFYVTRGNGGMPSFILVNEQGETFIIDIDKGSLEAKKELTLLPDFKNIVSAVSGGDLYIRLTDIDGNTYKY